MTLWPGEVCRCYSLVMDSLLDRQDVCIVREITEDVLRK